LRVWFFDQLFQTPQCLAIQKRTERAVAIDADMFDGVVPPDPGDIPADPALSDGPVKSYGLGAKKDRAQGVGPFGVFDTDVLALVLALSLQFEAATQLRVPSALSKAKIRRAC